MYMYNTHYIHVCICTHVHVHCNYDYLMIIAKEPEDLGVTFGLCDLLDADCRAIVTAHSNKRELIACM